MPTSSFDRFCERKRVRITCTYGGAELPKDAMPGSHPYKAQLRYQRRSITTPFFCGPAWEREPSAADVLSSLLSDASAADQDFGSWCGDLGYDSDSRKAHRTYEACVRIADKLHRFLGDDFDAFQRASSEH